MKAKRIALIGILSAIYVVLAYLGFLFSNSFGKITLEALPILIAGMFLGPVGGLTVGTLGSFISQIITYGITPTTILWVLPHAVSGLLVGYLAKKWNYEITNKRCIIIAIISSIVVTILNTVAIYADSKLYGYYSASLVFGTVLFKFAIGIFMAIFFSFILPPLLKSLQKYKDSSQEDNQKQDDIKKEETTINDIEKSLDTKDKEELEETPVISRNSTENIIKETDEEKEDINV